MIQEFGRSYCGRHDRGVAISDISLTGDGLGAMKFLSAYTDLVPMYLLTMT
jgi:hypothetical protein